MAIAAVTDPFIAFNAVIGLFYVNPAELSHVRRSGANIFIGTTSNLLANALNALSIDIPITDSLTAIFNRILRANGGLLSPAFVRALSAAGDTLWINIGAIRGFGILGGVLAVDCNSGNSALNAGMLTLDAAETALSFRNKIVNKATLDLS